MDKNNLDYFELGIKKYQEIKKPYETPHILLQVCCGACSCYPIIFLLDLFSITIFFSNSNIYTKEEYDKRLNALKKYVDIINTKFNKDIKIIEDTYEYMKYRKDLLPYKNEKEMGKRCEICIEKRMRSLFKYASEHNFPYVTTTMNYSRNKNSKFINELCLNLEKEYLNVTYFPTDFKKNNGQEVGIEITKKFDIYRQDFCGCEFSLRNNEER